MVASYEDRLRLDKSFARRELEACFGASGRIFGVLQRLHQNLARLGVQFVLCGDFAMGEHGYFIARPTVELLVGQSDVPLVRSILTAAGFRQQQGQLTMIDTWSIITFRFRIASNEDRIQTVELDGIPVLTLRRLIEMKLHGAAANPRRIKDLVDVQEMILTLSLDENLAATLDDVAAATFLELCRTTERAMA